jgi:peptidoglycan hydrolase-like protein with peptidoglycan-binding domain
MKNFKIRILSLGVLSAVIFSSTPVFAKTKPSSENKVSTAIYSETKTAYRSSDIVGDIINGGGVIEYGDQGEEVRRVQTVLWNLGYLNHDDIDGDFGSKTRSAVKSFQRSRNVSPVDGKVGKKTWRMMKYALAQD